MPTTADHPPASHLLNGRYHSPSYYAKRMPAGRGEGTATPSRIVRGIHTGSRLPDGSFAKLPAVRWGSRWMIEEGDFAAWIARITAAFLPADQTQPPRSPAARSKAADDADRQLRDAGI